MNRATAFIAAAVVGAAIAVGGCSSNHTAGGDKAIAAKQPAPSSSAPAVAHYGTVGAITDKIKTAGLAVTTPQKSTEDTYITQVGGIDYELTISEQASQQVGGSGIYLFPNDKAVTPWSAISQSMGGIAVVGDTWAVSLPTGGDDRAISTRMAPEIAKALGGKVVR